MVHQSHRARRESSKRDLSPDCFELSAGLQRRDPSKNFQSTNFSFLSSRFARSNWSTWLSFLASCFAPANWQTGLFFIASRFARGNCWTGFSFLASIEAICGHGSSQPFASLEAIGGSVSFLSFSLRSRQLADRSLLLSLSLLSRQLVDRSLFHSLSLHSRKLVARLGIAFEKFGIQD